MKNILIAVFLSTLVANAAEFQSGVVASNITGRLVDPTNFFDANIFPGTNISKLGTNKGGFYIGTSGQLNNWALFPTNMVSQTASNAAQNIANASSNALDVLLLSGSAVNDIPFAAGGQFAYDSGVFFYSTGDNSVHGHVGVFDGAFTFLNATALDTAGFFGSGQSLTNVSTLRNAGQTFVATNGTANSNITVSLDPTTFTALDIYATNNLSFTNWSNLPANGRVMNFVIRITPVLVNRTIVWPTLGGAQFGVRVWTNSVGETWSTLTNGSTYIVSGEAWGTNLHIKMNQYQ